MTVARVDLETAWAMLRDDPASTLLDVRTMAEWSFVGVPDLAPVGKAVRLVEWTHFPTGAPNPGFLAEAGQGLDPAANLLVICRSGARSQAAAEALESAGFTATHNVVDGFEGQLDAEGHRRGGWKGSGLPWVQQ